MSDPLELDIRRRLFETVKQYPGLHFRALARHLDTSLALVEYHVAILTDQGLIDTEEDGAFVRAYATREGGAKLGHQDRRALGLLRDAQRLHIVLWLLEHGPSRHKDLAAGTGMSPSRLSFHLARLSERQIVDRNDDRLFLIADATRVTRLLREHRPTPDMRDHLASLWEAFYGR